MAIPAGQPHALVSCLACTDHRVWGLMMSDTEKSCDQRIRRRIQQIMQETPFESCKEDVPTTYQGHLAA